MCSCVSFQFLFISDVVERARGLEGRLWELVFGSWRGTRRGKLVDVDHEALFRLVFVSFRLGKVRARELQRRYGVFRQVGGEGDYCATHSTVSSPAPFFHSSCEITDAVFGSAHCLINTFKPKERS